MTNTNNKTIYFDMDGTLAGLFFVKDFQKKLSNGDVSPYLEARPLYNVEEMTEVITQLKNKGYKIGVISYVSTTPREARKAKKEWLKRYFPFATEVHIIQEYTTKYKVAKDKGGILVDDAKKNREAWQGLSINAYRVNLVKELQALL
jgi:5'(3')-deoxyribonucleotidase